MRRALRRHRGPRVWGFLLRRLHSHRHHRGARDARYLYGVHSSRNTHRRRSLPSIAALRLPFGVTMSFAAVGTARFAIAQLVLQNHREHDMVPFGREHFVVASLREPHTGLAADSCCKTSSSASRFNERVCSKDNGKVVVARRQ